MVQDRPYRKGLSRQEVTAFIAQQLQKGSIEPLIADVLRNNLDEMTHLARLFEPEAGGQHPETADRD